MSSSAAAILDDPVRQEAALADLLHALRARSYAFVTPTPATHARVIARTKGGARDLRDVLGWCLPFEPSILDMEISGVLRAADALELLPCGRFKSRVRVSTLGDDLFVHSAYPTDDEDAVFFGPDSYRFADLIRDELARSPPPRGARLVDVGAGAGVGAIVAAHACPAVSVTMTDINPHALRLARINAAVAGVEAEFVMGPNLDPVVGAVDLALANPPYIIDAAGRGYRDGGDMHGGRVSCEIAEAAVSRLSGGGRLILYTGSAIIDGTDRLRRALVALAEREGCAIRYREIDPDVFGEELEKAQYREVERIAVVAAVIARPR